MPYLEERYISPEAANYARGLGKKGLTHYILHGGGLHTRTLLQVLLRLVVFYFNRFVNSVNRYQDNINIEIFFKAIDQPDHVTKFL